MVYNVVMDNNSSPASKKRLRLLVIVNIVLAVLFTALLTWLMVREQNNRQMDDGNTPAAESQPLQEPDLSTEVVVDGREHVWDVAFLPGGEMLFTERRGVLSVLRDDTVSEVAVIDDVYARGEGGLLGLAVDPDFASNRFIYTCFNSAQGGPDVRVVRWRLAPELDGLEERSDIVTGIPSNQSGRHSGCRVGFGPEGYLWITTGDAAMGATPQDPQSLGGKILRVDRDGQPALQLNQSGEFDARIFSYGHRNPQGLAFLMEPRDGVFGLSAEHGPAVDDEINLLKPGNFGWDPVPGYNESVPMTDKQKFPDAVEAVWETGAPTEAPSGATFVNGSKWQVWSGALVVAFLKDQRLKFFLFDDDWQLQKEIEQLTGQFGRLRAAVQDPDENLYITTDNGQGDKVIRVVPGS